MNNRKMDFRGSYKHQKNNKNTRVDFVDLIRNII